jgi:nitrogen-specific signal transduction histidine kinase
LRKNGELFDVSLTVSPVKDDDGHVIGASKIVRDISVQKATEAALMEQEKLAATTKLLNELAHNINNPLQSLTNLVYLAAETHDGTDAKTLAQEMSDDLERLSELVRKILELPTQGSR